MPAPTPLRPMLDDLVHGRRRQQLTPPALVTGLRALAPARAALRAPRRRGPGRIAARRSRTVARVPGQLPLQLLHPRAQRLDLAIHPQQSLDHDLTTGVVDRLRLSPLHTTRFATPRSCPPDRLNAYAFGTRTSSRGDGLQRRQGSIFCRSTHIARIEPARMRTFATLVVQGREPQAATRRARSTRSVPRPSGRASIATSRGVLCGYQRSPRRSRTSSRAGWATPVPRAVGRAGGSDLGALTYAVKSTTSGDAQRRRVLDPDAQAAESVAQLRRITTNAQDGEAASPAAARQWTVTERA
jgi:hypothetical protein